MRRKKTKNSEPNLRLNRDDWAIQGRCATCGHPICYKCRLHRRLVFGTDGYREGNSINYAHTRAENLDSIRFCSCHFPALTVEDGK